MNLKNRILAAILGIIFGLANPTVAMHNEDRHLQRMQMIFNHINPPEVSSAESFDREKLENHNLLTKENVKKLHDTYLKTCKNNFIRDSSMFFFTYFLSGILVNNRIIQNPRLVVGTAFFIPFSFLLTSTYEATRYISNHSMDNFLATFLENQESESKEATIKKLKSNPELFKKYLADMRTYKEFKFSVAFAALSALHWLPQERASFKTFLTCLSSASIFYYLARKKSASRLYNEKAKTLPLKELTRMHQLLDHLQPTQEIKCEQILLK